MLTGMKRRSFLSLASSVACGRDLNAAPKARSKRERMMAWLAGENMAGYTPAALFLHFGGGHENGNAGPQRHLEFFRYTDMDFVKIQFEQTFTRQDFLQKPADWTKLKVAKRD